MIHIPISMALLAATLAGSISVSLLVGRCAMYEFAHICLFH
jgi:hypothetical protein